MSTFVCNNKQNATMYKNTLYSMVKWFITHVGQANENSWIALSNDLVLDKSDCLKFTRVEIYIYIYILYTSNAAPLKDIPYLVVWKDKTLLKW